MRYSLLSFLLAFTWVCVQAANVPNVTEVYEFNNINDYKEIYSGTDSTLFQIETSFYLNNGTHPGLKFAFNITASEIVLGRWEAEFYVYSIAASGPKITAYSLNAPYHSSTIANDVDFTQSYVLFQKWLVYQSSSGVSALNLENSQVTNVKRGDFQNVLLTDSPIGVFYNWENFLYLFNSAGSSNQIYNYNTPATASDEVTVLTSAENYVYFNFNASSETVYRTSGDGSTKVDGVQFPANIQAIGNGLLNFIINDDGALIIQLTNLNNKVSVLKTISDESYYFEQAVFAPSTGLVWFMIGYLANRSDPAVRAENIISYNVVYTTDGTSEGTVYVDSLKVVNGGHGNTILGTGHKLAYFARYFSSITTIFAMDEQGNTGSGGQFDGHGGIPPAYGFSDGEFYCWLGPTLVAIK